VSLRRREDARRTRACRCRTELLLVRRRQLLMEEMLLLLLRTLARRPSRRSRGHERFDRRDRLQGRTRGLWSWRRLRLARLHLWMRLRLHPRLLRGRWSVRHDDRALRRRLTSLARRNDVDAWSDRTRRHSRLRVGGANAWALVSLIHARAAAKTCGSIHDARRIIVGRLDRVRQLRLRWRQLLWRMTLRMRLRSGRRWSRSNDTTCGERTKNGRFDPSNRTELRPTRWRRRRSWRRRCRSIGWRRWSTRATRAAARAAAATLLRRHFTSISRPCESFGGFLLLAAYGDGGLGRRAHDGPTFFGSLCRSGRGRWWRLWRRNRNYSSCGHGRWRKRRWNSQRWWWWWLDGNRNRCELRRGTGCRRRMMRARSNGEEEKRRDEKRAGCNECDAMRWDRHCRVCDRRRREWDPMLRKL
jgi:hypothetical protein